MILAIVNSNITWGGLLVNTIGQSAQRGNIAHEIFEPWVRTRSSSMKELLGVLGSR